MSIQAKVLSLKVELEQEINSLNKQFQAEVTTDGYNRIMILIGEKELMVEKLIKTLK